MDIFNKTKELVYNEIKEGEIDLTPDLKLSEIGVNSITFIKIIVTIEETFDIEFEDDYLDYEQFDTIQDVCDYIAQLKNEKDVAQQ